MSDIEARIRAALDDVHIESGRKNEHEAVIQKVLQAARQSPASGEVEAEVWKDVVGFENEYSVSSKGRVKSKRTGYIKAGNAKSGAGYVKCDLYSQDNRLQTSVHRVVCEAFHGPSEGREVNHKNGVKADNRAKNLEWSDRSANENHSRYVLGNLCKKLLAVNEETGEEVFFPSQRTAERVLGLTKDTVRQVLSGRKRNTKGWLFKHYTHPPAKVPDGWKLVPIESTSGMDVAACDADIDVEISRQDAECIWSYMIDASPTPPKEQ